LEDGEFKHQDKGKQKSEDNVERKEESTPTIRTGYGGEKQTRNEERRNGNEKRHCASSQRGKKAKAIGDYTHIFSGHEKS